MFPAGTYHVHTTWSDGQNSIDDMIAAAAAKGFTTIGISDHFGLYGDGTEVFGMRKAQFEPYLRTVDKARRKAPIQVLLGLEIDYAPDGEKLTDGYLRRGEFDYLIGSVHFIDRFPLDCEASYWAKLSQEEVDGMWRRYWVTVRQVAESGRCDFIGHLDLPKKFNFLPRVEPRDEMLAALEAIRKAGVPIEINTAGWDKPCADAYPAEPLLRECVQRGIPVVISDDSHCTADIGRHYPRAVARLKQAGGKEVCLLGPRHQQLRVPL